MLVAFWFCYPVLHCAVLDLCCAVQFRVALYHIVFYCVVAFRCLASSLRSFMCFCIVCCVCFALCCVVLCLCCVALVFIPFLSHVCVIVFFLMPHCTILCCIVLCFVVLCCVVLCCIAWPKRQALFWK